MKIKDALADIKNKKISNIYFLLGEDLFLLDLAQKSILSGLKIDFEELNLFKASVGTSLLSVKDNINSMPFMSERRAVVADYDIFEEDIKLSAKIIKEAPPSTVIIVKKCGKEDKRKEFDKYIISNGCVVNCGHPSEDEAADYIVMFCAKSNLKISKKDARFLYNYTGSDLSKAMNEVKKLVLCCEKVITADDIKKYASISQEYNIFTLHELMLNKKFGQASKLCDEILTNDNFPVGLLSILASNIDLMLIARACRDVKYDDKKIFATMKKTAGAPDFRINKAIAQCGFMSAEKLRKAKKTIADMDFGFKQGLYDFKTDLFAKLMEIYV